MQQEQSCSVSDVTFRTFEQGILNSKRKKVSADEHIGQAPGWTCQFSVATAPSVRLGRFGLLSSGYFTDIRLPGNVDPIHYDVELVPYIDEAESEKQFTTDGSVDFTFTKLQLENWNKIVPVHVRKVYVKTKSAKITKEGDNNALDIAGFGYDLEREFFELHLVQDLIDGANYTLHLEFVSELNDELSGFYRSKYVENGDTKYLATTQFEDTDARRAFPCLDEPNLKATFKVKLGRKKEMISASNMNKLKEGEEDVDGLTGYVWDEYDTTVTMSTYLLAFHVSDFGRTASQDEPDFFGVFHMQSKAGQAEYSANMGQKILRFFEEYFNVSYPLPKADMAAIPDFGPGAMENWGLVNFRETLLMFKDGSSSITNKESITSVVAHELGHFWFGDIVTMEWWGDLWLNEGFATYVQFIGADHVEPTFMYRERQVVTDLQNVFATDALETTRPIIVLVENPVYDKTFTDVVYDKGGAVLRMIEHMLTQDTFTQGLSQYLQANSYGNTLTPDLWNALDDVAEGKIPEGMNMSDVMDSWVREPGYPVVTTYAQDDQGLEVVLCQKRFFLNPEVERSNQQWVIPISIGYPGNETSFESTLPESFLTSECQTQEISQRPYIINVQETGYYRVNYDYQNWEDIKNALTEDHDQIHFINRAQILDDAMNLAKAQQLPYPIALDLTLYLKEETHYIPWASMSRALTYLDQMIRNDADDYDFLKRFVRASLQGLYDKVGFESSDTDAYIDIVSRKLAVSWLCAAGDVDCTAQAAAAFAEWRTQEDPDTTNPIDVDLRAEIYASAVRNGDEEDWEFLWDRFLNTTVDSDRQTLLRALGTADEEDTLKRYLNYTIVDGGPIRSQDVLYVYRAIGAQVPGRNVQFEWIKENFEIAHAHFGDFFFDVVDDMVNGYAVGANTQEEVDELQTFLDIHGEAELGGSYKIIEQGIEIAKTNQKWRTLSYSPVMDWLRSNFPAASTSTTASPTSTTSAAADKPAWGALMLFAVAGATALFH